MPKNVSVKDPVSIEASHDTYGITFRLQIPPASCAAARSDVGEAGSASSSPGRQEGHPPDDMYSGMDPAWASSHAALQPLAAALSKAMAQDPLVYRQAVRAAVAMAARPQEHGGGADPKQAAEFCCRLMSA